MEGTTICVIFSICKLNHFKYLVLYPILIVYAIINNKIHTSYFIIYSNSILFYYQLTISKNMSIALSQSDEGECTNYKSGQSSGSNSLSARIPLNYSISKQNIKGPPIYHANLSSFTPYKNKETESNHNKQLRQQQFSTLRQLNKQMGFLEKNLSMAKIQSQQQLSDQKEGLARIFRRLKKRQDQQQEDSNFDFVRMIGDIIFAKDHINPIWPCQIKKIQRVPGSIPQIIYYVKFINEKTACYVSSLQIVSFTTQNCEYVEKQTKNKRLKKAIKIAIKMAEKNLSKKLNQKITMQYSYSTQSNQRQAQFEKGTQISRVIQNQIVENKDGFLGIKKSLFTIPQVKKSVFMPIVITSNRQKQKIIFKQSLDTKSSIKSVNFISKSVQKPKRQVIPKTIRIVGLKREQNQTPVKTVIQFKKQTRKNVKRQSISKDKQKEIKNNKLRSQVPQDLKIETLRLPLSLFKMIQKFDKNHFKKVERRQSISNQNSSFYEKYIQKKLEFSKQDESKLHQDQNSRYDEVQNDNLLKSISLQIQYEKYPDADDEQTTLIQQFLDKSQIKEVLVQQIDNEKPQNLQEMADNLVIKEIKQTTELTKQQEKILIKNIQSYNDQLFKVKFIKNKDEVQEGIIQALQKVGPNSIANSQIVDQICMMTGLMKQQTTKSKEYYSFYKKVIQTVKKSLNRISEMMKRSEQQNLTPKNLKTKINVENKLWLLKNCINSR